MKNLLGAAILLIVAMIWGSAFVAQKFGSNTLGPFSFVVFRNFLAIAFLLLVRALVCAVRKTRFGFTRYEWKAGFWCGLALFVPMWLQQVGIGGTSSGVCGFLTTNYVLAVPVLSIFLGRKVKPFVWAGVALALLGTYLISVTGETSFGLGELMTILCALGFGVEILVVDHFVAGTDPVALSIAMYIFGVAFGVPFLALPSERMGLNGPNLLASAAPLLYCGIMSSGIAYTLQNISQRMVQPTLASILMSLESVFAALAGAVFCHEVLTPSQYLGCALVFAAVLFTEIRSSTQSH